MVLFLLTLLLCSTRMCSLDCAEIITFTEQEREGPFPFRPALLNRTPTVGGASRTGAKTNTDVSENLWPMGSVGLPGGRQVGRSAERGIQVGGPGRLHSGCGVPHVEGQCALSRGGRTDGAGAGAEPKLRFGPLRLRVGQASKRRETSTSPQTWPEPSPPGFGHAHTAELPSRPGQSSRAPRAPARAAATTARQPRRPTTRQDRRCACVGAHAATAAYVITCATPRRTACGLLFRKVQEWDRQGRCPWPSWQKVPLVSKSC